MHFHFVEIVLTVRMPYAKHGIVLPNFELQFAKDNLLTFNVKSLILTLCDGWNQNALMLQIVKCYNITLSIFFLAIS